MNTAKRFPRIALLILAVFASGIAWAQTSNGTLVGSVTDPTGAVLTKATVTAVSPQYGLRHEVQTDSAGTYRMESLQQGTYTVQISAAGFETLTTNGVVINGSLTTTINGKLSLAAAQQTIEVQPSYGLTDTEIERILEESIDHAEKDFAERQIIEARNEAETILKATAKSLADPRAEELASEERAAIEKSSGELRAAVAGTDYKLVRQKIDELNQATMHLAEVLMNRALQAAVQGKRLDDV